MSTQAGHGIRCRVVCHGSEWRCHSAGCGAAGHVSGGMAYESGRTPASTLGVAVSELPSHHDWTENEKCLFDVKRGPARMKQETQSDPKESVPVDSDRLREQIAALRAERHALMARMDTLDREVRGLLLVQARQDHPCDCVRLNRDIGVFNMSEADAHRRATFGLGFVSELLSADRGCWRCSGSGVPTVSGISNGDGERE